MHLPSLKPQYYSFVVIIVLLLGVIACRDFEDCRSIYTNEAIVKFKGENILSIEGVYFDKPIRQLLYGKNIRVKETGKQFLEDLKGGKLAIPLHPRHNMVTLFFYKTPSGTTISITPDTLTIFYTRVASLISPSCGIQQEYIIDSVETSFIGSKIIKAALRNRIHEKPEDQNNPNIEIQY